MAVFRVDDMSCGHCIAAITEALHALDADAKVEVDLEQRRVSVESDRASADDLRAALGAAGYEAVEVERAPEPAEVVQVVPAGNEGVGFVPAESPKGCCCR